MGRAFDDRVPRNIPGTMREKVTGGWTELHTEAPHDFCYVPEVIRIITSRSTRWAGHVALMGETRNAYKVPVRKL
jgi:hypothetical protein